MFDTFLYQKITELLFPIPCSFCAKSSSWICEDCLQKITILSVSECPICRRVQKDNKPCKKCENTTYITELRYLFEYKDEIKKLIKLMKYRKFFSLRYEFAKLLNRYIQKSSFSGKAILVSFAPSSKSSLEKRGFNHMSEIATYLQKINPGFTAKELFIREETVRQATLDKDERATNLVDKIHLVANIDFSSYKQIIILDDLATTGATLSECCRVIKVVAPNIRVSCVTLTRPSLLFKSQPG